MSHIEAMTLAAQLKIELPKRGAANALWDILTERSQTIALDMETGDWLVVNKGDITGQVFARVAG